MYFAELQDLSQGLPGRPQDCRSLVLSRVDRGENVSAGNGGLSISYVADGVENYVFEKRRIGVEAGQLLVIPPRTAVEYSHARNLGLALGICFFARADELGENHAPLQEQPILLSAKAFEFGRQMEAATRRLVDERRDRKKVADHVGESLDAGMSRLISDIGGKISAMDGARPATRNYRYRQLERARAYLHEDLSRAIQLPELAASAGMSRFHLARLFKDVFGLGPAAYHRRLRLREARALIKRDEMSCSSAAMSVGFEDLSTFSRAYKREFGDSPRNSVQKTGRNQ